MNLPQLHEKMIAAARASAPDDRVPYAFEKRVTALIQARAGSKGFDSWVQGLWRAALPCVAIAVVCGAWAFFAPDNSASTADDLSQNFDSTLLASVDSSDATP
jgi:hypothetical protein